MNTANLEVEDHFQRLGDYAYHAADRSGFQRVYRELLEQDPRSEGPVLEIGSGGGFHKTIAPVFSSNLKVDGVDPFAEIHQHAGLREKWQGRFEDREILGIPKSGYPMVVTYNVVEHIEAARPFFQAVSETLAPGGAFYALTPHANHPFAFISRSIENLGGKRFFSSRDKGVNDYPAYYRLNRRRQVLNAIEGLGFVKATFWYVPCAQWDRYFPPSLRIVPQLYDRTIGLRSQRLAAILIYRLEIA